MLIRTLGVRCTKEVPRSMLATIFFFNFFILPTDFLKKGGGGAADSLTKLKVIIDDDDDTSNYNMPNSPAVIVVFVTCNTVCMDP